VTPWYPLRDVPLPEDHGIPALRKPRTPRMVEGTSSPVLFLTVRCHGPAPFLLKGRCMARGRTTTLTISLTPAQQQTLLGWQHARTGTARHARRGRVVLLLAEGMPMTQIARLVGMHRRHVSKWGQRFLAGGIERLADQPRPDARRGHAPHDRDLSLLQCRRLTRRRAHAITSVRWRRQSLSTRRGRSGRPGEPAHAGSWPRTLSRWGKSACTARYMGLYDHGDPRYCSTVLLTTCTVAGDPQAWSTPHNVHIYSEEGGNV
jgi:transposase